MWGGENRDYVVFRPNWRPPESPCPLPQRGANTSCNSSCRNNTHATQTRPGGHAIKADPLHPLVLESFFMCRPQNMHTSCEHVVASTEPGKMMVGRQNTGGTDENVY